MKIDGERRYSSTVLDLGNRWRWVVSFKPKLLYTPGEKAPTTDWLGGPKSWSGCCGVEKNPAPAGNWTPAFQSIACRYTDWTIPPPSLWHCVSYNGTYVFTHSKTSYHTTFQAPHSAIIVVSLQQFIQLPYEHYCWQRTLIFHGCVPSFMNIYQVVQKTQTHGHYNIS
jgi:hypothetical protein